MTPEQEDKAVQRSALLKDGPSLRLRVSPQMYDFIQSHANVNFDGNLSMAVRALITKGISVIDGEDFNQPKPEDR